MLLHAVDECYIEEHLKNLNPKKSSGLDNIPARFLKDGASVLKSPITHIINLSIRTNVVPDDFKIARVTPLYKKNERTEVGNYRPISVICCVSKILESTIYDQLYNFFKENDLLYEFQSGFNRLMSYSLAGSSKERNCKRVYDRNASFGFTKSI